MAKRRLGWSLVHMMRRNSATVIDEPPRTFIIDAAGAFPSIHAWPTQYTTFQPIRSCQCLRPCLRHREPDRSSRFLQGERQQGAYLRRRIPIKAQVEHRYREPSLGRRTTQKEPLAAQTETTRLPRSAPHQSVPTMECRDLSGQVLYQLAEELRIMPIPRLGVGY